MTERKRREILGQEKGVERKEQSRREFFEKCRDRNGVFLSQK